MTDIDPQADLEVRFAGEHMTVKVPLAGPVTGEWLQDYQKLALAAEVRAQAGRCDDRAWIIVTIPASSDQGMITATLDAARVLIADADAAERPPATAAGIQAEKRWPTACTLIVAMAVPRCSPPGSAWVRHGRSRRWRHCCWWPSSPLTGIASTAGRPSAGRCP
jgi:hypothetical protein